MNFLKRFFLTWIIFKVFNEFVTTLLLFYVFGFLSGPEARGVLAPWSGTKPAPPTLEGEVLTTGPPGKSLRDLFIFIIIFFFSERSCKMFNYMATLCTRREIWVMKGDTMTCKCSFIKFCPPPFSFVMWDINVKIWKKGQREPLKSLQNCVLLKLNRDKRGMASQPTNWGSRERGKVTSISNLQAWPPGLF